MTTPSRGRCLVELFALCGFALTYPVLVMFGRAPDWFILRGAGTAHIIAFGSISFNRLRPAAGPATGEGD